MTSPNIISVTLNLLDYFDFTYLTCTISACSVLDYYGSPFSRITSPTLTISGSGSLTQGTCKFEIDSSIVLS